MIAFILSCHISGGDGIELLLLSVKKKIPAVCCIYLVCIQHPYLPLINWCLISRVVLPFVHDQQPLHLHCLQVPSHVEQRLQELERGIRSEHRAMGQERIDQQAGVSDKLQEVMLPFTHSIPHVPIDNLVLSRL